MTSTQAEKDEFFASVQELTTKANGALYLELMSFPDAVLDINKRQLVRHWMSSLKTRKPLCLLCDHGWSAIGTGTPPGIFCFTSEGGTDDRSEPCKVLVSAICMGCATQPALTDRVVEKLRDVWPGAYAVTPS